MSTRRDPYAILDREVMPWGSYAGKRISKVPVDYCKKTLREPMQLNPYLRELLQLRIEQEKNWLKDLKSELSHYRRAAEELESALAHCQNDLDAMRRDESERLRTGVEPRLRQLRRLFAARYHPDTAEGSAEMMAMVNRIFNELEGELKPPRRDEE